MSNARRSRVMRVRPCSFAAEPTSASYTDPPAISPSESRSTKPWAPIDERNLLSGKLADPIQSSVTAWPMNRKTSAVWHPHDLRHVAAATEDRRGEDGHLQVH